MLASCVYKILDIFMFSVYFLLFVVRNLQVEVCILQRPLTFRPELTPAVTSVCPERSYVACPAEASGAGVLYCILRTHAKNIAGREARLARCGG